MKNCKKCLKLLDIESNFFRDKRIKGGYRNVCKICDGSIKIPPTHIYCNKCESNIEYTNYSVKTNQCKDCYVLQRKENKIISSKIRFDKFNNFTYKKVDLKICTKCNLEKNISLFPVRRDSPDGYRNQCSECFESIHLLSKKKYRQKNKKLLIKKDLIYRKERMAADPLYRAKVDSRNIIRKSLSKKGYSKKSKTQEILGCSFEEFRQHIESMFQENMSWENRNEWHIDHIVPVSFAENEKELLLINHYTNLRPLWIADNQLKSDNIEITNEIYELILNQRINSIIS